MTTTQTTINLEQLQYPIGRFAPKETYSIEEINRMIEIQETAPNRYQKLMAGRSDEDLAKTYRDGSWTVQQLVHHVADIQLLNFLRLKKALTENDYVITLVNMDDWAKTPDATIAPIEDSLLMFTGITRRFVYLWRTLDEQTLTQSFYHPSRQINLSLKQFLYMATWHVMHHQGHIESALGLQPDTSLSYGLSK